MAQRILMQLEALDKYSHEILAKFAEKRSLDYIHMLKYMKTPFLDDFDLEYCKATYEKTGGCKHLDNSHGSVRKPEANWSIALENSEHHKCGQKENIQQAERNTKKIKKLEHKSRNRRPTWKSEAECFPVLASSCQQENSLSVINNIGLKDIFQHHSCRSFRAAKEHSAAPENSDLLVQNKTQKHDKKRGDKAKQLNSEFKNARRHLIIKRNNILESEQDNIQNTQTITNSNTLTMKEKETVPLSLEDAMKKQNVKIITVGQRNEEKQVQNASETHPVIYNSQGSTFRSKWPYLHTDFQGDRSYLSSYSNKEHNQCDLKDVHSVLRNSLDYTKKLLENKPNVLQSTTLKKRRKELKRAEELSLADIKLNIIFLANDGSKTNFEFADDKPGLLQMIKQDIETYTEDSKVAMRPTLKTITTDVKENPNEVGPVINGVNPRKGVNKKPSSNVRLQPASKPLTAIGSKPGSFSLTQRPKSVGEMHKWSYIAISKPLTSPQSHPSSSPSNYAHCVAFSEAMHKYTDRPDLGGKMAHVSSLKSLTARPVMFESKKLRPFAVPSDTYFKQPDSEMKRSAKILSVEMEIKKNESPPLNNAEDFTNTKGAEHPSKDGGPTEKGPAEIFTSSTVYPNASPVISIPTAQTDAIG
ncbi:hypothetical protein XENTR_v10011861 [Xenopus tropicalis]|uniref:Uncharacterized protein C1orf141 homolog n=1 Tax=Xenopus tropicalis TaxID=8364 RepID=A0A8J1JJB5_XENTR|nr:uncharacterized protein C1orf141 homolog [Xenopus tropicalis]XP_017949062.1 uncharacterized protein C1orf141 homolog [Xenopus tropicalis]XP_031756741.1 uncharacterized protein C1orf141 homolog [Xenopus tropicalis]KAE8609623.1 hypothetical protein XENTR_v10011861 [Xenopus tropicalis]KAE8609624.1 hypothetical protein XENTR_v10011861 [Xenopus tropicalis]KAE8609625.1 hypothetical protein XENTR_v10011861 [Xenopus tropicalis]KAE8609626.1 hypothetical protein XENTR_v10011861 [Xenopus tropicalis]|eukprot:XP_017949061.1 PREDICTED: uncharacterized protein C1orf141 homolog [Xenopus tropicalis]